MKLEQIIKRLVSPVIKPDHSQQVAPCGDDEEHWSWRDLGFSCPVCLAIESRAQQDRDENRMAEKIAAAIVRQMKEGGR